MEEEKKQFIKKIEDQADSPPPEARYRDIELEQEQKEVEAAKQALEEIAARKEEESNIIDTIKGGVRKELTQKQIEQDAKVKKRELGRTERAAIMVEKEKYRRRDEEMEQASAKKSSQGLLKMAEKAVEKMLKAYEKYVEIRPGVQPGERVKDSPKRSLVHDFDMGTESVKEHFQTSIDGVKVEGTVTSQQKDGPKGQSQTVGESKVELNGMSSGTQNLTSQLGQLSPEALHTIKSRVGQGEGVQR